MSLRRGEVLRQPQDRRPGRVVVPVAEWRLEAFQVLIPGLAPDLPGQPFIPKPGSCVAALRSAVAGLLRLSVIANSCRLS
jgi:hypothetical protein